MPSRSVRINISQLGALSRLAAGGQGIVYAAPGVQMQYASSMVYKEYKATVVGDLDVSVLEAMPTYLESLRFSDGMELLSRAAWPCRLVEDGGIVKGFVMPAIRSEFFFDMRKVSGITRVPGEFQHLLNDESFLARRQIQLSDRQRYELLAEMAGALALFHSHGIAVGDMSPKNMLYSLTPAPKIFFIDCDAMRLQGRSVVPQAETPDWDVRAANPGEELATPQSDSYKLALLALRLFAGDQSTRDLSRLPVSVPKQVREIVRVGLSKNPMARPLPLEWGQPLGAAATASTTLPRTQSSLHTHMGAPTPRPVAPHPNAPGVQRPTVPRGGGIPTAPLPSARWPVPTRPPPTRVRRVRGPSRIRAAQWFQIVVAVIVVTLMVARGFTDHTPSGPHDWFIIAAVTAGAAAVWILANVSG
jgi:hypothetical protein